MNCNFSLNHFFETLELAKKEYTIGPLKDHKKLQNKKKSIILRHDIDFSLDLALLLAKKENKMGIKATYFILLQGKHYNSLSKENMAIIKKISQFGHEIGLHYDSSFTKSKKKLNLEIKNMCVLLGEIINKKIITIAQDNPSIHSTLNARNSSEFLDAMNSNFLKNITYLSDSGQNWRRGCMCNHLGKIDRLYILTHPIWWAEKHTTSENSLKKFQKDDSKKTLTRHKKVRADLFHYIRKLNDGSIK